jgi:fatty-acyl-CoA synthase
MIQFQKVQPYLRIRRLNGRYDMMTNGGGLMKSFMTVGEALSMAAYCYPQKVGVKDLNRAMTFQTFNQRCCRLANGLLRLGLAKGDRFAVIAYNCVEWMEIYGAAAKAGLIAVPIMFRLLPNEYRYILENSGVKAFIVARDFVEGADTIKETLPRDLAANFIYLGEGEAPKGYRHYEELLEMSLPDEPAVDVKPDDLWVIIYTSGTTGKPKGAARTHASCVHHYLMYNCEMGFNREDIGLLVMPMCHANSFLYCFNFTYNYATACIYSRKSFDPEDLLKTFEREKITYTSLVPTQYIMILSLPEAVKRKYDVSSLRNLLCSSAPARKTTKLQIMDYFKNANLFEGYGSSEAGIPVMLRPEHQIEKIGSIGREMIGVSRIKLLDEKGREVPTGSVGEIFTKQPCTFEEYWNDPEKTKQAFRGDYCTAGDMAYQDEDGFFYLVDRKHNMIITGGENVYPSEVETVIITHRAVQEVCVIGVPDEKWGEAVKAVVVLMAGFEDTDELKQEIMEYCRENMAGFKNPKSIDFVGLEDIPRTATGKVMYGELRDRYGRTVTERETASLDCSTAMELSS